MQDESIDISSKNPIYVPFPEWNLIVAVTGLDVKDDGTMAISCDYNVQDLVSRGVDPSELETKLGELIIDALKRKMEEDTA